jgi:hypothetical protein
VRLAAVWASVWPGKQVAGRTESKRIGRGHARVQPPVYLVPPYGFSRQLKSSTKCAYGGGGGIRPCRRRGSTALSAWALSGSPWTPLGVLTRRVAHDRGDGVRGVFGTGAGAAATTRCRCGHPKDERPCVFRRVVFMHGEP